MGFVQVQPAYILYAKPFRDTSLLLEAFTLSHGRISLVGRGARARNRRPRFHGLLQPFVPLFLSWKGKTDLMNLTAAEPRGAAPVLEGEALFSAWYLNELLMRAVQHCDPHAELFDAYHVALYDLAQHPELSLRRFEKAILATLGVVPSLDRETQTGTPVHPDQWYKIAFGYWVNIAKVPPHHANDHDVLPGELLLALQADNWVILLPHLRLVKHLFRNLLNHVFAGTRIKSRDLFARPL